MFLVVLAVVVLMGGFLAGLPRGSVEPVLAATACQAAHPACGVFYRTAALDVSHYAEAHTRPVEPNTGESFSITAYWNTAGPPPCFEISETATVDVYWTGSAWALANKSTTTNITDIQVCSGNACGSQYDGHAWSYRLIARVTDPVVLGFIPHNLRQVVFTTTSVDDGYVIDENCDLSTAVSPTAQSWSATDSGSNGFECGFSCSNSGPSMTILYE
jgi:hypothetical protein